MPGLTSITKRSGTNWNSLEGYWNRSSTTSGSSDLTAMVPSQYRSLATLPNDILLLLLMTLDIRDLVTIRRVNKRFLALTQQGWIWKTYLRLMNIVPPPLPPAKKFSHLHALSGAEAEQMVTRAVSFQRNWKSDNVTAFSVQIVNMHHKVLSMALLPGGKHLVASVTDGAQSFGLMVLALDRKQGNYTILATIGTGTKAYSLRAKYMTVKGVSGIVIAYIRREFSEPLPLGHEREDPSDYDHTRDIDPPVPFRYECSCFMISLDTLEDLVDQSGAPGFIEGAATREPPFYLIGQIRSRSQLDLPDLGDVRGLPSFAVVKKPETIIFKSLDSGIISSLTLYRDPDYEDIAHELQNFRILPYHHDILVVYTVPFVNPPTPDMLEPPEEMPTGPRDQPETLFASNYCLPDIGEHVHNEAPWENSQLHDGGKYGHVQISEPVLPPTLNPSIRSKGSRLDPPVCIYFRNFDDLEVIEARLRPCSSLDPLQPLRNPMFSTLKNVWSMSFASETDPVSGRVPMIIPGHNLPLVWTTVKGYRKFAPPLMAFHSHIHDMDKESDWELDEAKVAIDEDPKPVDSAMLIEIEPGCVRDTQGAQVYIPWSLLKELRGGVVALAWDDWTGRIFVSTLETGLMVIDLSQGPLLNTP